MRVADRAVGIIRTAGRAGDGRVGFPDGCSGLESSALARCKAEPRGGVCLLCKRSGDFPVPELWDAGPGWNVAGVRTVQAVRFDRDPRAWVVVVMIGGRLVDGQYPPIFCTERARAVETMFARARQIKPRREIVPRRGEEDAWECDGMHLMIADPWG